MTPDMADKYTPSETGETNIGLGGTIKTGVIKDGATALGLDKPRELNYGGWTKYGFKFEVNAKNLSPEFLELFDGKNFPPEQIPGEKPSVYIQRVSEWAKANGIDPKNVKFEISLKDLMT